MDLNEHIRDIPDWPNPGVVFRDWNPLLAKPGGLAHLADQANQMLANYVEQVDLVAGAESRGFILGSIVAEKLNAGFIAIRKPGKTPPGFHEIDYELEYGSDRVELAHGLVVPGQQVLIHDDLLATGGTAQAAAKLVQLAGGQVAGFLFAIELEFLPGRKKLETEFNKPVLSLHSYSSEEIDAK
jgi:adenine phosphoribosyltransferase